MRRPYSSITNPYAVQPGVLYPPYLPRCYYYVPPPPQYYYYYDYDPSQYNRKKQRRQAAAGVVESLWGNNTSQTNSMGRTSTAQPRPVLNVPVGGYGPVAEPNENDVLCGRGGRINSHVGNVQFRDIIQSKKKEYLAKTTKKLEKAHIAAAIVNDIRSMKPPGRFLKEDKGSGMWFDIGDAKAIKKTGQALREDAPEIRPEIDGGPSGDSSGDEARNKKGLSPKATSSKNRVTKADVEALPQITIPLRANAHGPQLLPGTWSNVPQDHQGQASMPPPFQNQMNPYMTMAQAQNNYGQFVPGTSRQAMQALAGGGHAGFLQDMAFGRAFHPPASQVGSDKTMSTISGLTDQPVSNISSLTGSGMNMSTEYRKKHLAQTRNESLPLGEGYSLPPDDFAKSSYFSSHMSDMTASFKMSDMASLKDMASMNASSLMKRSSSFPEMSSIVDSDTWKAILGEDDDVASVTPRSMLSGSTSKSSRRTSRMSMMQMSMSSMASSGDWMNTSASFDGRSMLSEMSSDLNALDLAS